MKTSIWEAIKEYRAASKSDILSSQQQKKEKQLAVGKFLLGVAEKAENIPLVMGTLFGTGMVSLDAVDITVGSGAMLVGGVVVAKGLAALGKRHEFVKAYKDRNYLEEQLALYLDDDPNDFLNNKTRVASTSMEMLIGYNRAYNAAKRFDSYMGFIKFGKGVVTKAMALVEKKFIASLETKEEKDWVDRFIKAPVNELIPDALKSYLSDAKEKRRLLNWIESENGRFEESDYKKILDKEERDLFGSHKVFEKDWLA